MIRMKEEKLYRYIETHFYSLQRFLKLLKYLHRHIEHGNVHERYNERIALYQQRKNYFLRKYLLHLINH